MKNKSAACENVENNSGNWIILFSLRSNVTELYSIEFNALSTYIYLQREVKKKQC